MNLFGNRGKILTLLDPRRTQIVTMKWPKKGSSMYPEISYDTYGSDSNQGSDSIAIVVIVNLYLDRGVISPLISNFRF